MNEIIDGIIDVTSFSQLDEVGVQRLATFNAERARGLVHTDAYRAEMAKLQQRFDEWKFAQDIAWKAEEKTRRWWRISG